MDKLDGERRPAARRTSYHFFKLNARNNLSSLQTIRVVPYVPRRGASQTAGTTKLFLEQLEQWGHSLCFRSLRRTGTRYRHRILGIQIVQVSHLQSTRSPAGALYSACPFQVYFLLANSSNFSYVSRGLLRKKSLDIGHMHYSAWHSTRVQCTRLSTAIVPLFLDSGYPGAVS